MSINKKTGKLRYTHTMKYHIAVRIKELSVSRWINIKNIQGKANCKIICVSHTIYLKSLKSAKQVKICLRVYKTS